VLFENPFIDCQNDSCNKSLKIFFSSIGTGYLELLKYIPLQKWNTTTKMHKVRNCSMFLAITDVLWFIMGLVCADNIYLCEKHVQFKKYWTAFTGYNKFQT